VKNAFGMSVFSKEHTFLILTSMVDRIHKSSGMLRRVVRMSFRKVVIVVVVVAGVKARCQLLLRVFLWML
jgi:hypothetical protein